MRWYSALICSLVLGISPFGGVLILRKAIQEMVVVQIISKINNLFMFLSSLAVMGKKKWNHNLFLQIVPATRERQFEQG